MAIRKKSAKKPAARKAKRSNPRRAARKANGQFARKPRANRTRKPATRAKRVKRAKRANPRYTLRNVRRNPLVECSRPSKYVGAKMHWSGDDWTIEGCDSTVYKKSGGPGMFSALKVGAKKRKPVAKRAVWEAAYRSRKTKSGAVKLARRSRKAR